MKKLYWLVAALVILSMVLTACGAPATEAPAEPVAEEPTAAQPVAEEPTAEEPGETEGPAPAAQEGGWCSGTNIVFFPGGSPGGGFETVVYNGAVQAAADTGANVEYLWSDWDPAKMVTQLQEAVATNPDGIAIMGHPGDEAYKDIVDQAEAEGIVITSMNTQTAGLQAQYATKGYGYVGAILHDAGYALGKEAATRAGLVAGDKAFVWGLVAQAGRGERTQGIIDALEDLGVEVVYQEIDDATNAEAAAGVPIFTGIISANPDIKLVVTDHGNLTGTMQTFFEAAGFGPDDAYGAGFDMSGNAVEAIRSGYLDLVIDQQQWLQGYFGVLQICLTHNYGFAGLHIDTGAGFADKDNIEMLAPLVEQQIR
ncbi:MAG: substrate-binding domain-containing protein [Anaerolineales bacterium]|nr:substrate-binding domain-containing protein [Anaerolineales bacterium]